VGVGWTYTISRVNEDKASRYQRLKRTTGIFALVWSAVLLAGLLVTGGSIGLRNLAQAMTSRGHSHPAVVLLIYVTLLSLVNELVSVPLSFYSGFLIERRYGLTNQTLGGWALDEIKGLAVGLILGGLAASIMYFFIRLAPDSWWLPTGAIFALLIVGLANLGPVLLLPLFYTVKPLDREALRARLMTLADRASARVLGVYEWGLAAKTKKANAALTGLAGTRRILVSDTMLADYSEDEIEVVLAHELAHHVHGDIWKGLIFESALILGGFFASARVLRAWVGSLGLTGPDDIAGLPLLLLTAGAVSLLMVPAAHAMSRHYERQADRFALKLTRNPTAFISAMRRLAAQNLAEEHPSKIVEWLFYSHPPIRERVAAAQAFKT
jgi:Zn-dependent protease with chaperone function